MEFKPGEIYLISSVNSMFMTIGSYRCVYLNQCHIFRIINALNYNVSGDEVAIPLDWLGKPSFSIKKINKTQALAWGL